MQLNESQTKAANALNGYILIKAGAGSGKTRTVVERINNLLRSGVSPHNILAITFTNKAAGELKSRLTNPAVTASTIHSLCVRIMRKYPPKGYNRNFQILDSDDQKSLVKHLKPYFLEKCDDPKLFEALFEATNNNAFVSDLVKVKRNHLTNRKTYKISSEDPAYQRLLDKFCGYYINYLRLHNQVDFDDLIIKATEVFKNNPAALAAFQNLWTHISIDEYQDTSQMQLDFLNLLTKGIDKRGSLCVVGDPNQSIYRFNGADVSIIDNFAKTHENTQVFHLRENYRSTPEIINTANSIFDTSVATSENSGIKPLYLHAENKYDEIKTVINLIKQYNNYTNTAILYRSNWLSRDYEQALTANNIPYQIFGGLSFYERAEIKDLLAYMRLLTNPKSDIDFLRIINKPTRGFGNATVSEIIDFANQNNLSYIDGLRQITLKGNKEIERQKFVNLYDSCKTTSLAQIAKHFLTNSGLEEMYKQIDEKEDNSDRVGNLNEFVTACHDFDHDNHDVAIMDRLDDFLANVTIDSGDEETEAGVSLMTIHKAKGLEFDMVFVVGVESNILPGKRSYTDDAEETRKNIQEEKRVFYVAVTRAKKFLIITNRESRYQFGKRICNEPSPFLTDKFLEAIETE